jgi:hypothetical protein
VSAFPNAAASKMGNVIVNPGSAAIGAVETYLRCPAWWLLDMSPFWGFPALRGSTVVIPGVDGTLGFQRRIDQGVYTAPLQVTGDVDASAVAPSASHFTQLRDNLDYLWENVGTPPVGATRSARLVLPDYTTIDFEGQFALTLVSQSITDAALIVDVTVPAGRIA